MSRKTLIVFTVSFPYGTGESTFLSEELKYLSKTFKKIIIVPGYKFEYLDPIPSNTIIDESLAFNTKIGKLDIIKALLTCFTHYRFIKELIRNLNKSKNKNVLRNLIGTFYAAILIKKWIICKVKNGEIVERDTIFYSYWLAKFTLGLVYAKEKIKEMKVITRGHGGDIYLERTPNGYFPFREFIVKSGLIDKYYIISENGVNYLSLLYPGIKAKLILARIGTKNPGFRSNYSKDEVLRVVTCSGAVKVKRLDLLINCLTIICKQKDSIKVKWTHIGDGPELKNLAALARRTLGKNVHYEFLGFLSNTDVFKFYQNNEVDFFINVSSSEGIPLAIMESQSVGIPAIATDVGGTNEIVNCDTGYLLDKNISPTELANLLLKLKKTLSIIDKDEQREKCIKNWNENYSSEINFQKFCIELKTI